MLSVMEEKMVSLTLLVPRDLQPRRYFDRAALESLAESILAHGVLEPLLVRPLPDGRYAIVAGERRYRAAEMAGLREVPVRVLNIDEMTAEYLALMENLQRQDLNPYEETVAILDMLAYRLRMAQDQGVSLLYRMSNEAKGRVAHDVIGSPEAREVEQVFAELGRMTWQSFVQNRLPLLNLPEDLRLALESGSIPYTAALELRKIKDEELRRALLEEVKGGLPIPDLRARVKALRGRQGNDEWYRKEVRKLARLRLENLPPEKRQAVEAKLKELLELIG